jgi:hypothetical protein
VTSNHIIQFTTSYTTSGDDLRTQNKVKEHKTCEKGDQVQATELLVFLYPSLTRHLDLDRHRMVAATTSCLVDWALHRWQRSIASIRHEARSDLDKVGGRHRPRSGG